MCNKGVFFLSLFSCNSDDPIKYKFLQYLKWNLPTEAFDNSSIHLNISQKCKQNLSRLSFLSLVHSLETTSTTTVTAMSGQRSKFKEDPPKFSQPVKSESVAGGKSASFEAIVQGKCSITKFLFYSFPPSLPPSHIKTPIKQIINCPPPI